jgi:outer membrane protein TolC
MRVMSRAVQAKNTYRESVSGIRFPVKPVLPFLGLFLILISQSGCLTAEKYRVDADKAAESIIMDKQKELLGITNEFRLERPSDILRRRLIIEQGLQYSGNASLGTDSLETIEHWPEDGYPNANGLSESDGITIPQGKPLVMSLLQSLQIGAQNSSEYQTKKEDVFTKALNLDLRRDSFGFTLGGGAESKISMDKREPTGSAPGTTTDIVKGVENSGSLSLSKTLETGAKLTTALGVDIVKLLTQGRTSSYGISGDASISIPLLRGAGRHIVTEPLTQAERDVVYAIYEFEKYKKSFAVNVVSNYLEVLRQLDQVRNNEENYRNSIASSRRTRSMADAGRSTKIQVDQAVQSELKARDRWISSMTQYMSRLDTFKSFIGLPPDADIVLENTELDKLIAPTIELKSAITLEAEKGTINTSQEIDLNPPTMDGSGPFELDESVAIELGIMNRLDLRVAEGKVYDAQRGVVVLADALGAELTLFGSAQFGESRSLSNAGLDNADLHSDQGLYTGLLSIDLPFERTSERNAYRNGFIALERATRDVQNLEDGIKLSIRNALRNMAQSRESIKTQTRAVYVAENRVRSTEMFFDAGRAELRDVLEAQDALLAARNDLTTAVIDYRVAELEFQRDAGILNIDEKGLIEEYSPEEDNDVK